MEIFSTDLSLLPFCYLIAVISTAFCVVLAVRSSKLKRNRLDSITPAAPMSGKRRTCRCSCACGLDAGSALLNSAELLPLAMAPEKQTGASMMEQLVPEIRTHALSYLDYPSLCRLSMTNSLMRKAANDDNAWKALYHKDFTMEQDAVIPVNGWKAYYAATRAIVNINAEFFKIIRERALSSMSRLWLSADYVKCIHASGEYFSGYDAVIQSWQIAFNWELGVDFQIREVGARVLKDIAWVTMKAFVGDDTDLFHMTNTFEYHNGRWYMVHHHSST